jgi:hypothetical protein
MAFIKELFFKPYPAHAQDEVEKLTEELVRIGKTDDFLAERPFGGFNMDKRHIRARDIGQRLFDLGGFELMEYMLKKIRKRLNPNLASHLSYAWADIGGWAP